MLPDPARMPAGWLSSRVSLPWNLPWKLLPCVMLVACSSFGAPRPLPAHTATQVVDRDTTAAVLLADTIQTLQRLTQAQPAEQAEILSTARQAYERAPMGGAQLRYALVLAIPGPSARDPVLAQTLLQQLAAAPEALVPAERAMTLVELAQLNRELDLKQDYERVHAEAAQRDSRDRLATAQRRLQAELDDNARLRKQLDEAQAKLDAIANIERNITERKSGTESHKP